jgi:ribosomal protein L32
MQELLSNQELLKDNDNDCSSGSESDPSEDNLDPEEITSVYPVTLTPKPKPVEKKKSLSPSKPRAESNRSLTSQKERTKIIAKCKICGEPEIAGHVCVKPKPKPQLKPLTKPQSSITLVSQPYYNAVGKKVRDQATQTIQLTQTPSSKNSEEQKSVETRNTSISPVKKEIRTAYRASSSEDPAMLARMWKQEKAFPNFTRGARQSSAWKYNDSIRK